MFSFADVHSPGIALNWFYFVCDVVVLCVPANCFYSVWEEIVCVYFTDMELAMVAILYISTNSAFGISFAYLMALKPVADRASKMLNLNVQLASYGIYN